MLLVTTSLSLSARPCSRSSMASGQTGQSGLFATEYMSEQEKELAITLLHPVVVPTALAPSLTRGENQDAIQAVVMVVSSEI